MDFGFRDGLWIQRWTLDSEMDFGFRDGLWIQRWTLDSEMDFGGGIYCFLSCEKSLNAIFCYRKYRLLGSHDPPATSLDPPLFLITFVADQLTCKDTHIIRKTHRYAKIYL